MLYDGGPPPPADMLAHRRAGFGWAVEPPACGASPLRPLAAAGDRRRRQFRLVRRGRVVARATRPGHDHVGVVAGCRACHEVRSSQLTIGNSSTEPTMPPPWR